MATEKIKHRVCYELNVDLIKEIDAIAESENINSNEALAFIIDYVSESIGDKLKDCA